MRASIQVVKVGKYYKAAVTVGSKTRESELYSTQTAAYEKGVALANDMGAPMAQHTPKPRRTWFGIVKGE